MTKLYPSIHENEHFFLAVDEIHSIYVEECGSPTGIPVVFLHGGPGAGCEPYHRQFFNPEKYRIILFDQRGCGRSTPHASLENNTTPHLIEDMEKIREKLNIKKWLILGGSWGSTLALAYAETYPERVMGLIVRGIFLARPQDLHWFYQEGANHIFPDYWQDYLAPIPLNEQHDLLTAYHKRLTGKNEIARMRAAKAWSIWEGRTANLQQNRHVVEHFSDPHNALSIARIEIHYFVNNIFLPDNSLLDNAWKLRHIPGFIIHGRYDMICPIEQAFELHQAWNTAYLQIISNSGHAACEKPIISALVQACDEMVKVLQN